MDPRPMLFTFKRFVLHAGRIARAFCNLSGTTPQRTDLLLLVRLEALPLKKIALELGVTPPVISRMVAALFKLGWVAKITPEADRRQRLVTITPAGREVLRMVFENDFPMEGEATVQFRSEFQLMYEWELVFEKAGVRTEMLSLEDQRALLQRLTPTVWKTIYFGDPRWDGETEPYRHWRTIQRIA